MTQFIEISLALFWTGYAALLWRLLRAPLKDAAGHPEFLQGEASCNTQPTK